MLDCHHLLPFHAELMSVLPLVFDADDHILAMGKDWEDALWGREREGGPGWATLSPSSSWDSAGRDSEPGQGPRRHRRARAGVRLLEIRHIPPWLSARAVVAG